MPVTQPSSGPGSAPDTDRPVAAVAPTRSQALVGWARRHPRTATAAGIAAVLALTAASDWPHASSRGQLQGDLQAYATQIRGDVLSCGSEVQDTLSAYNQIMAGVSTDRPTAVAIADRAALDCSPAGNAMIVDLAAAQPPRSLAVYHLDAAAQQFYSWADGDAVDAMQDVHTLLVQAGNPARLADLRSRLADMHARDLVAQTAFDAAAGAVGAASLSFGLESVEPQVLVG